MRALIILGGLLMIAATDTRADMIDSAGVAPWEHCALCHGLDGVSHMAKFPKLAGQRYAYLEKQLRDFKTARRTNDGGPMDGITRQLGIAPLLQAARWFSEQPTPPPAARGPEPGDAAKSRALFEFGKPAAGIPACVICHGAGAKTRPVAPRLEAQHARYLEKQLADFRAGARTNDPDSVMRRIAAALTKAEIAAISRYLAAQPKKTGARP